MVRSQFPQVSSVSLGLFLLLLLGLAPAARAVPAPKTPAEMTAMADLVVDATCIQIVCEGPPVEDTEKFTTTYLSTLVASHTYKGTAPATFQIRGQEFVWKGIQPVGGWHQGPVPKGWVGKIYLQLLPDGTYTKVWWNAMEEDTSLSAPLPLPDCSVLPIDDGGIADAGGLDGGLDGGGRDGEIPFADGEIPLPDAGPAVDGTISPDAATPEPANQGGCSCRASGGGPPAFLWLLIGLGVALAWRSRRRAAVLRR